MERGQTARPYRRSVRALSDALALAEPEREELDRAARQLPDGAAGSRSAHAGFTYSLPPDTHAFTGRSAELGLIMSAATQAGAAGGVVVIRAIGGMPGVGKTALAVRAAQLLARSFPQRQLFLDLHGFTPGRSPLSPEDALAALLAAAGADPRYLPADLEGRAGMWRDRMSGQRALLVLDNAASSGQVAPLLPGSAGCLVLVTSRRHLADLPGATAPVVLDVLPPEQARSMFIRLAPRAAEDAASVAEIVELTGYLPLAISLLARVYARHPAWSLGDLARDTRARMLTLTAEHLSVAAAFELSWQHLEPCQQRFFSYLPVQPGSSCDAYAAAALANVSMAQAALLLDELHAEGLLTETCFRRYGMHDLIRQYVADRAAETLAATEREAAMERLLDYYQHTASRADALLARQTSRSRNREPAARPAAAPELTDDVQALAWARAERSNLLACLDHAGLTSDLARLVALTAAMAEALRRDGSWTDAEARHAAAAEAACQVGDQLGRAGALLSVAELRRLTCDFAASARIAGEALAIFRDLGDRAGQANAERTLGDVRVMTGDYPAAVGNLSEALDGFRILSDQLGEAYTLIRLAEVQKLTGDHPAAIQRLSEALGIFCAQGDRLGEALSRLHIGDCRRESGNFPAAVQSLEAALDIYRVLDDRLGLGSALGNLGYVLLITGDYARGAQVLHEARNTLRDLGNGLGEANTLVYLGGIQCETGDYQAAADDLDDALRIFRELGNRLGEANALTLLAGVNRLTGDYPAADRHVAQALGIYRDIGYQGGEAEALNEAGMLHRARKDLAQAVDCHLRALSLAREYANPLEEGRALAGLGRCAREAGNTADAIDRLRQAHALFLRCGAAESGKIADELGALAEYAT
jgi:tetratricopeptide (TPR) repeat protein